MNSYQRYMAMVNDEKADIVPRIPILMHFAAEHINSSYADFAGDHKVMCDANQRLVEDYDFDQLDIMSDPYRETSAFGGKVTYMETTVPRCTAPLANSKDIATLLKPDPTRSERMVNAIKGIKAFKEYGYQKYSITGWVEGPIAEAADLRGIETFLMDMMDDEAFVCQLMDLCVDAAIEFAIAQIDSGCDTIGIGDALASQVSTDMYERLIFPKEKRLIRAIKDAGGLARLHICGDINHLMPLIADLGIDIIDCDWQVDIINARKILGSKVTIAGNLDPVNDVMRSTPEKIHQSFRDIYNEIGNPYFVNAGCEIPPGTPIENFKALCKPIEAMQIR
jgi:MtaA/CmuA family methyltransferase